MAMADADVCSYWRKLTGLNDKLLNLVKCDESILDTISARNFVDF